MIKAILNGSILKALHGHRVEFAGEQGDLLGIGVLEGYNRSVMQVREKGVRREVLRKDVRGYLDLDDPEWHQVDKQLRAAGYSDESVDS